MKNNFLYLLKCIIPFSKRWKRGTVLLCAFFILLNSYNVEAFWILDRKHLAEVNDEIIVIDDFQKKLNRFHSIKNLGEKMKINIPNVDYRNLLNELINEKLLIQEAYRIGLDKTNDFEETYHLAKLNLSLDLLKKEEVINKVKISGKEIYDQFVLKRESVRIRHLFTRNRAKGEAMLKNLAEGADFAALAEKISEDSEDIKKKGGDIGFKRRGELPKKLEDEAFSLSKGMTSGLIETGNGFHIIKVEDKKIPTEEIPEDIKKSLRKSVFKIKVKERNNEYLSFLRKKAIVNINQEILKSININDKPDDDRIIVATVNDEPIRVNEILMVIKNQLSHKKDPEGDSFKRNILNGLIRDKLLEMEISKRDYEKDKSLQYQLAQTMDSFILKLLKKKKLVAL